MAQEVKLDDGDASTVELMRPIATDPFEHVREAFRGFCKPQTVHEKTKSRCGAKSLERTTWCAEIRPEGTSCDETQVSHGETWNPSLSEATRTSNHEHRVILTHPFENLKKALQHGFCDPLELAKDGDGGKPCAVSVITGSLDSDDTAQQAMEGSRDVEPIEEDDVDDAEQSIIIVTHPASRAPRIMLALENFFFTVSAVFFAFYALRKMDSNAIIEFSPKEDGDDSSFVTFSSSIPVNLKGC